MNGGSIELKDFAAVAAVLREHAAKEFYIFCKLFLTSVLNSRANF